jgi:hypothetical protein
MFAAMSFWSRISPKRAALDFYDQWQQPTPHRWQVMGVAIAATFAIFTLGIPESERGPPPRPEVTYITSWAADRTDEEIIASNIENQMRKERRQALLEAREERRRELYRALGEATFIDVDAMEEEIARERAAEQAAARAADVEAEQGQVAQNRAAADPNSQDQSSQDQSAQ